MHPPFSKYLKLTYTILDIKDNTLRKLYKLSSFEYWGGLLQLTCHVTRKLVSNYKNIMVVKIGGSILE